MKTENFSLSNELARRLPFVAFERDEIEWEVVLFARTIENGMMLNASCPSVDRFDAWMDANDFVEMGDVDRCGPAGKDMAETALIDLASMLHRTGPGDQSKEFTLIMQAVEWLRAL